jgi:hypothetical protein
MNDLTAWVISYGRDEPPPEVLGLRAGPLTAELESGDLRYIRHGSTELVRRIGVSVRDVNWGTPLGERTPPVVERGGDSFRVTFGSRHEAGELDYEWLAVIEGLPDGTLRYAMDGVARRAFPYCRIGFTVLHPLEGHRDARYVGHGPAGAFAGALPSLIAPVPFEDGAWYPLLGPYSALRIRLTGGGEVAFRFEGDLFEMEDQRNWTDGSLKTYCTPISLGYPFAAEAGQEFHQRVTVTYRPDDEDGAVPLPTRARVAGVAASDVATIKVGGRVGRLPALGFGMASHGGDLSSREAALLRALRPDHVRVDLHLETPGSGWEVEFDRAIRATSDLGCALEVAVFVSDAAEAELAALGARVAGTPVARYLVFHDSEANDSTTPARWVIVARGALATVSRGASFAGGAAGEFMALNRVRPRAEAMDAICFPINPQVHAADERSIVETVEAQGETVLTARGFSDGRPVVVSAVTLKQPFNPYAVEEAGPGGEKEPSSLPPTVDPRQMSLFAAAWTVGSLGSLARAGAASVTYYETTGWRGLVETEAGPPRPDAFRSFPGMVFPVYHVFADLADLHRADVLACDSSRPLEAAGLALESNGRRRVLVANLTCERRRVVVAGLCGEHILARVLDEQSARVAMAAPGAFRGAASRHDVRRGVVELDLGPYAVARVDEEGPGAGG